MLLVFAGFETARKFEIKDFYLLISDFLEESQSHLEIRVSESFIFWHKVCSLGLSLEHFSQSNFKIFHHQPTKVADMITPTIESFPMARPCMFIFHNYFNLANKL